MTKRVCMEGFKLMVKNIRRFEVDKGKADAFTDSIAP